MAVFRRLETQPSKAQIAAIAISVLVAHVLLLGWFSVWLDHSKAPSSESVITLAPNPLVSGFSGDASQPKEVLKRPIPKQPVGQARRKDEEVRFVEPQTGTAGPVLDAAERLAGLQRAELPPMEMIEPDYKAAYLNNPKPSYPLMAVRRQIEGTVTLLVHVLPDGHPQDIRIDQSSGSSILDNAALNTVKTWRFVPARRGEVPVPADVRVPIVFSLK